MTTMVPLMEQKLLTLPRNTSSPRFRVAKSIVLWMIVSVLIRPLLTTLFISFVSSNFSLQSFKIHYMSYLNCKPLICMNMHKFKQQNY